MGELLMLVLLRRLRLLLLDLLSDLGSLLYWHISLREAFLDEIADLLQPRVLDLREGLRLIENL